MHCLAAILAACMHDAMHPGVDNNFVIKQQQALARRFNDQHVLEMNSLSTCLYAIHDQPQFNFLQGSTIGGTTTWLKVRLCHNTFLSGCTPVGLSHHQNHRHLTMLLSAAVESCYHRNRTGN